MQADPDIWQDVLGRLSFDPTRPLDTSRLTFGNVIEFTLLFRILAEHTETPNR